MSKTTQDTKNNDAWLDNPDSDHEQTTQIKSDVKDAKSEAKPKKLKDLFNNTQQNIPAKDKPKEYKPKDTQYKPKDKNTKSGVPTFTNSSKNDFDQSNNKPLYKDVKPTNKNELNKPEFQGKIQSTIEEAPKTHKNQEVKPTQETKEDFIKPEFKSKAEGKIVDLNVKEDLYLKNRLEHKTEEVKYSDKTQKDRENKENKDEKEHKEYKNKEQREYKPKEYKDFNNKERKKRDDGILRNEEGIPVDEDGFHDVGAKKKTEKHYYNNNYKNNQKYFNNKKKNYKSEDGKPTEEVNKEEVKLEEEAFKEEAKKVEEVMQVNKDKVEIVMPSKEKGLKGLFK